MSPHVPKIHAIIVQLFIKQAALSFLQENRVLTLRSQIAWMRWGKKRRKSSIGVGTSKEKKSNNIAQLEREMIFPMSHGAYDEMADEVVVKKEKKKSAFPPRFGQFAPPHASETCIHAFLSE